MNAPLKSDLRIDPAFRHDPRPRSAVSGMTGLVGLAGLFAWTVAARSYGMVGPLAALTGVVACGVPMVLWALFVDKVHRNPTTGIDWDKPPRPLRETSDISLAKIAGLWGIWAMIGALYCIGALVLGRRHISSRCTCSASPWCRCWSSPSPTSSGSTAGLT